MKKKTLLILFFLTLAISCGKQSDPEYKECKFKYINQKNIV